MQDVMRREAKNQNKAFTDHKKREKEVKDFNKNQMLTKNKRNDNFEIKSKDSYIYGYRESNSPDKQPEVLDPILEGGERR